MRIVCAAALALFVHPILAETAVPVTTVILVRHAEKVADTGPDQLLSETGIARAQELARVLADTPIDVIYATQYQRTSLTAEPLAKARGAEVKIFKASSTYAADFAQKIRAEHLGQTVLVVGHSNTTIDLIRELGVPDPKPMPDTQYDSLFVVTLAGGQARSVALRFGAANR